MTNLLPADVDAAYATKYPTLTSQERGLVAMHESDIAEIEEKVAALQKRLKVMRAKRSEVFQAAASRATEPVEMMRNFLTTGEGYARMIEHAKSLHRYIFDASRFGVLGDDAWAWAAQVSLVGSFRDPDEIPALAAALIEHANLVATARGEFGLVLDASSDPAWAEYANGMQPVPILDDNEAHSHLVAHTADGSRAVLLDQRWGCGEVVAAGTLTEVLAKAFTAAEAPAREDEPW